MEHEGQSPHRGPGTQGSSHQAVTHSVAPGPLASRLVGRLALKQLLLKQMVEERVIHFLPSVCTLKLFSSMCCTGTQASPGSSAAAETPVPLPTGQCAAQTCDGSHSSRRSWVGNPVQSAHSWPLKPVQTPAGCPSRAQASKVMARQPSWRSHVKAVP